MIAAAKALTMNRVRVSTLRLVSSSARKMPASAAMAVPSPHATAAVRPGRAPLRAARSRWSTTARIAIPSRVR